MSQALPDYRFASFFGEEERAHVYEPLFCEQLTTAKTKRLFATASRDRDDLLADLAACLKQPYRLLYVLHTPRGEEAKGRYQGPEMDLFELRAFLARFSAYLAGDGRFDLWVYSPASDATLILDRHDLLYGYGPLEEWGRVLGEKGYNQGTPCLPYPHAHFYRAEFDADARALLEALPWVHRPLRPEDEQ